MDPYLEDQVAWSDFHIALIAYGRDALSVGLPDHYVARMGEQIRLVSPDAVVAVLYPDVALSREPKSVRDPAHSAVTGTMTVEPVTVPLHKGELEEIRDTWIELRKLPEFELVTVIEILSPTNKTGVGRVEYLDKRDQYIDQPLNLVELDMLVGGRRLPMQRPMPAGDYYALIARTERRPNCDVYALSIRNPLPAIPIPLKAPDPDVLLNLGDVVSLAYDRGRYHRTIDYARPLELPLRPDDREWAEQLARSSVGRASR
jgi:hypothetical protein